MPAAHAPLVFLFSDIEGSTRLWEQQPAAMREALARHDRLAREAVAQRRGRLVKGTGDGIHATFDDAGDALAAMLQLQRALAAAAAAGDLPLAVRCGLHAGHGQTRDNDVFGPEVNRAARIMAAAHGGQMLVSQAVADGLAGTLPAGVTLRDLGAVRLKDLPRPERLWQVLAPPLRCEFPPLRTLAATPHNLPEPLNRFIGREALLAALQGQLRSHRLVTLLGTGGIGKSRLSLQLGRALLGECADGVWRVELASVGDPDRVPQAVAAVLGLREQADGASASPTESLCRFVADRELLLILDNCEHLLAASAALAKALLQAGPRLRVLATSREPLHLAGEAVCPVPALSLPALQPEPVLQPDALLRHEAVQMFVDRAASALPGFAIDAGNAAALAEICHRLDGIPLALELAAARVRVLPLPLMAERLRDSLALLRTADSTVAPRQRTLQRLIDWSHALLDDDEQRLFRRLAVFVGGWTLDSAEAVCADDAGSDGALPADAVLDTLSRLVEKSLVVRLPDDGGALRYRLLETVRLFAAQCLQDAGEAGLRDRHLAHYLALAEAARAGWRGPAQPVWRQRLDAERDNLLAAQAHAARQPDGGASGLRLAGALRDYWIHRGLFTLGLAGLRAALDHPQAQAQQLPRAQGLFHAGHLCIFLGRFDQAVACLEESLAIVRALGEGARVASVLQPLGTVHAQLGNAAEALACFEQAVAAERGLDRPRQLAAALVALALWFAQQQQADRAEPLLLEALALTRAEGDDDEIATTLLNLAMLELGRSRPAAAVDRLGQALPLLQAGGSPPQLLAALDLACALAVAVGDWRLARRWRGAAEAVRRRTGLHREAADLALLAPWLARLEAHQAASDEAAPGGPADSAEGTDDDGAAPPLQALADWLRGLPATSR